MIAAVFEQNGAYVITYRQFHDDRGYFMELNKSGEMHRQIPGVPEEFVQENMSFSKAGVFRGMHYQTPRQGKLVRTLGNIMDFWVNLDESAPNYGQCNYRRLDDPSKAIYIPPGYAHGFLAIEPSIVIYHCTSEYCPEGDRTIDYRTIPEMEGVITNLVKSTGLTLEISSKDLCGDPL